MIRCPRCGLRLRDAEPSCPQHGAVPAEPVLAASPEAPDAQADEVEARTPAALLALGYRVTGVLGRGGFGIVYGAERLSDGLTVALKLVLPEQPLAAEQLAREVALLEVVAPPWVPAVYEQGVVLDRRYVAIEYIAAPTLADRLLAASGPIPLPEFTRIAHAILKPLAQIHAHGIAHRDLKPENVFLCTDADGQLTAKIIDFGLASEASARVAPQGAEQSSDTQHGAPSGETEEDAVGTPEYMSPEQCNGRPDADTRSDIYSIGALFYELLTGAPPFWGKSADVREWQRSRRPAPLLLKIECPSALDEVIRRCLAKDPARRFADVAALEDALRTSLMGPKSKERSSSSSADAPRAAAAPVAAAREKRTVGLVFFESSAGLAAVQSLVTSSGGQIVQTNGAQYVAAFGHDVGDNPVRIAFAAAQRLTMAKLVERSLVDVAQVSVQARPDGSRRLFSPLFAKKDRFPTASDPLGIVLTGPATEVIPDLRIAAVEGKQDRFLTITTQGAHDATTYGIQQATLIGRDEPLAELREHARESLLASLPSMVTVIGEPGYGKTHFARGLEQQLERLVPAPDIIRMTAQESIVGAASQLLPDLLRRLLTLPEQVLPEEARGVLLDRLGAAGQQVWAAAALALGWIDSDHPDVRRLAAAPGALRLAAARAAGEALRKRARLTPVAVVLDDAHLADDALLDALEYATLQEGQARLWVCALVRPHFEQARTAWGARAARSTKLKLDALGPVPGSELARRLLHPIEYVTPAVLLRLVERTQGVPRLLVELIRGLKRDGVVRRSERGTGFYLATDELDKLPDLPIVQWNAVREVEALPAQLAGHARLSSVLGNGFSVAELESLIEILEREDTLEDMQLDANVGLQRLVDAGMLIRHRNGTMDFRHSLLRDTIYRLVPEPQRKRMHRAAFEMYQLIPMPQETRVPRLALHAAQSGEREAAARAYLELAQRSKTAHAYLDAEAAFGHALDNLAESDIERICTAAGARGVMRWRLGRHEDALRDLRRARELAKLLGQRERELDLMLDEATVLDWMRDFSRAEVLMREAAAIVEAETVSELVAAKFTTGISRIHHRSRDTEACIRVGADAVEKSNHLGDAGYEARVVALLVIAPDCVHLGRFDEAERYFEMAIREATAHADWLLVSGAHINRAVLGFARKDARQAIADLTRATQLSRETGEPMIEYCALLNIAEVGYAVGDLELATDQIERGYALARRLWGEANRELGNCELVMARIALQRESFAEARELLSRISQRSLQTDLAVASELALFPSEQAVFDMVDLCARDANEAEWADFERRWGTTELQPMEELDILEGRALAALRAGRLPESRRLFELAMQVSAQKPNLMSERVERAFARAFAPPAS
ncbi:MAG: hypothetical protein JWN04_1300 [Myxococcaceae bacterium]|nr:hypothetical protein [Myxococcaceae bacterium]